MDLKAKESLSSILGQAARFAIDIAEGSVSAPLHFDMAAKRRRRVLLSPWLRIRSAIEKVTYL
jgi:hypothetical protein